MEEKTGKKRFYGIDELRGFAMVVMALDHVRDFIYRIYFSPTDLSQTTAPLFLTRWITNICAPIFVFLAGTGAFLHFHHRQSKPELTKYLVSRGLVVVLLDLTLIRFSYNFNLNLFIPNTNLIQVLWAIGWSMCALGFLIYLPEWLMGVVGLAMVAGHNLLDGISPAVFGDFSWLWIILHSPGDITIYPGIVYKVLYPLVPWIGVMTLGYLMGHLIDWEEEKRKVFLPLLGVILLVLFTVIRWVNIYGDPFPWSAQKDGLFTFLSFINCTKYPPSLLYLLMTLGLGFLILSYIRRHSGGIFESLRIFGNVPMFFYVLHFYAAHLFAILYAVIQYRSMPWFLFHDNPFISPQYPSAPGGGFGYGLGMVYFTWIAVVGLLYPLCKWYMQYKTTHDNIITRYL